MNPTKRPARSVDGFVRSAPSVVPPHRPQTPSVPPAQPVRPFASPARRMPKPRRNFKLPQQLQLPLIILLAMTAGMFASSSAFGQVAIAVYGIVAWRTRIRSRTTFILALIALLTMCVMLVGKGDVASAQNFATYTFLLLVAGVFCLGRELKQEGGRVYSIRTRQTDHHKY